MKTVLKWKALWAVCLIMLGMQGMAFMAATETAQAEPTPEEIIAAATTTLKNLPQFSFEADLTEDVVSEDGAMIQVAHHMIYMAKRPDKISFRVDGDELNKAWYYNGKTITAYDPERKTFSREAFPPTIDEALTKAHNELNLRLSLIGMARTNLYDILTDNVVKSTVIGLSRVNNQTCYQLLLERERVNVQLWIQTGDTLLLRKILITYKQQPGVPQWSAVITKWNISPELNDSLFEFTPPQDSRQIKFLKRIERSDA